MKFTVLWKPAAQQDLADLWMDSKTRGAITAAANQLDRNLSEDADQLGESRDQFIRIAFESPLGIEFEVDTEDRKVLVLGVWCMVPPE